MYKNEPVKLLKHDKILLIRLLRQELNRHLKNDDDNTEHNVKVITRIIEEIRKTTDNL